MSKKIMIICGSPRKNGSTNTIAAMVADAASEDGAEVEMVDAAKLEYKTNGCTACMGCQGIDEFHCVIDDEARPVLAKMPEADVLVFATPVYWHGPTAQLKMLLDRMFSLVKVDETDPIDTALKGCTIGLIGTAGGELHNGLGEVDSLFKGIAAELHMPYESLLLPILKSPAQLEGNKEAGEMAQTFGRKLAAC